ncbi:MAG: AAA family ATPase [Gammaproteobacteria bacterium]|nr:AAA family ATPase [Gammaproteobacteria bacterium]
MANKELAALFQEWGLSKYVQLFSDNDIGVDVLPQLTESHLQELGVSLGDRLRMLEFFRGLAERTTAQAGGTQGERRQLTVMFCDLVGSTSMSEGMDPESYREVIVGYRQSTSEVIREHTGFIARHLGDGLLVYFGYPMASEDDPSRAIRAGLAIIERVKGLPPVKGKPLQARIGIATGVVVVGEIIGEGFAREREVSGETPNLAARLQGLAEPNTVVVSPSTRRLAGALFDYEALGPQSIKGLSRPVSVWRVLADSGIENRFEARRLRGELGQLIGRASEMSLLRDAWVDAANGSGRLVILQGEAGVGKSRLVEGIRGEIELENHPVLSCYGTLHYEHSAFHPFLREVERTAAIERNDATDERLEKLMSLLAARDVADALDSAQLLATTLGFRSDEDEVRQISPREHRLRVMSTLEEQLLGGAQGAPSLLILEDLHWFDASSVELIGRLVERLTSLPVLMVMTCRPEYRPPWTDLPHTKKVAVTRLSTSHCVELIKNIATKSGLSADTIKEIVAKTDGNPLFIEEVTQTVLSAQRGDGAGFESVGHSTGTWVPMSLHDSLMARLDGLNQAKEVAQVGAALGRNFSHELISRSSDFDEAALSNALDSLVRRGILRVRGVAPNVEYIFKHALVQEAAYGSLLHARRRTIHARIGTVLERNYPELMQRHPEVCALHHARAGLPEKAVEMWSEAGRLAFARSANLESVSHFRAALAQLRLLEKGVGVDDGEAQECRLRLNIGAALVAPKGYAAPEVRSAYARANELSRRIGDAHMQFAAVRGLWHNHVLRGELRQAKTLSNQLLRSARVTGAREHALVALRASGLTALVRGEFDAAKVKFEQGIKLYRPEHLAELMQRYGEDPGLYCLLYAAWVNDLCGDRGLALQRTHQAISLAERSGNHFAISYVLALTAQFYQYRREPAEVLKYAERANQVAEKFGVVQWSATANIARGWALAASGDSQAGIALLRSAIAHWRDIGAELIVPYFLSVQAQTHLLAQEYDLAEQTLVEANVLIEASGQSAWASEVARLRAEVMVARDPSDLSAEPYWQRAHAVAREQGAELFRLRAIFGLAQWEKQRGVASEETRHTLEAVLGRFGPNSETPDTIAAKRFLVSLD